MKIFTCVLLILSVLFASCDTNNSQKATEEVKNSVKSESIKSEDVTSEAIEVEDAKPKVVKPKCNVYTEDDFREKFTCLFFEERDYYNEYVKQINSVDDCDKFYGDLKNKNNAICEKYKCSKEDLRNHCVELFSDEEDTLNKISKCAEKKCYRSQFKQQCEVFENVCVETVIVSCLNKSGLAPTDYNITSCAVNNKSLIQKECSLESCIRDEVKTCIDSECEVKPTEKYIKNCMEKEKDACTTQNRAWVVFA